MPLTENTTVASDLSRALAHGNSAVRDVLKGAESTETVGYVPSVGDSGVTIGTGFDLGQFNETELKNMGLDSTLIATLKPYLGLKKDAAKAKLKSNPLQLSASVVADMDNKVWGYEVDKAISKYEKNTGFAWDNLPNEVQDSLLIQSFQLGDKLYKYKSGGKYKETDFTKQLRDSALSGDYTAPAQNLATFNVKKNGSEIGGIGISKRNRAAADVMLGNIHTSDFNAQMDKYYNDAKNKKTWDSKAVPVNAPKAMAEVAQAADNAYGFEDLFTTGFESTIK